MPSKPAASVPLPPECPTSHLCMQSCSRSCWDEGALHGSSGRSRLLNIPRILCLNCLQIHLFWTSASRFQFMMVPSTRTMAILVHRQFGSLAIVVGIAAGSLFPDPARCAPDGRWCQFWAESLAALPKQLRTYWTKFGNKRLKRSQTSTHDHA